MGRALSDHVEGTTSGGRSPQFVPAATVRARIARALHDPAGDEALGAVTLRPHQRVAVTRVWRALGEFGGALLADEPGLGKSYVALAIARRFADALLVCPASLRTTWFAAMRAARLSLRVVSQEALSRGARVAPAPLVVVDEAHHFRNPATIRYKALATLTADARVIMLTATPVHNSGRDLDALLALFRGRAPAAGDALLARCVVRRTHADTEMGALPAVQPTRTIDVADDDAGIVGRIAALPPPLSLADGGDAAALVQMTLLRQWASSAAALRGGIDRHLARTDALLATLEAGRLPTRHELAAWTTGDDAMQLAFPELMASRRVAPAPSVETATRHRAAVAALRGAVRATAIDERRVALLLDVLRAHPCARVLCFAQFEETIRAYWRALRHLPGMCALSARGATITGGTLPRSEAIARFAPLANGTPVPRRAEEIRVLLATDMLSEGVNLQDASVVVHLDQPWTPARLEQRIGRVVRLGSSHEHVAVYSMRSPTTAARLLEIERRLLAKSAAASSAHRSPDSAERIARCLTQWRGEPDVGAAPDTVSVSAVRASASGWLALVAGAAGPRLVASVGSERGASPGLVAQACVLASGVDIGCAEETFAVVLGELEEWLAADRAAAAAGLHDGVRGDRRSSLRRVASAGAVPRARRAALADLAASAWHAASSPMSLGREERLRGLAASAGRERDWLQSVANVNGDNGLETPPDAGADGRDEPLAVIVFGP